MGDPYNGYKIVNKEAGTTNALSNLTTDGAFTTDTYANGGVFVLDAHGTDGFYTLRNVAGNTAYINEYQNVKFGVWNNAGAITDLGSALTFPVAEIANPSTVTYNYQVNGVTVKTEQHIVPMNAALPATTTAKPYKTSWAEPTGTADAAEKSVNIAVTTTDYPFTFAADVASISNWYRMKINRATPKYADYDETTPITLTTTVPAASDESTHYAFVGNPFDGYRIVNKVAGTDKALNGAGTNNETITLANFADAAHFELSASESSVANSFLLRNAAVNEAYLNDVDNHLGTWATSSAKSDLGSAFTFEAIETYTYTVSTTQDGGGVVYNSQNYLNGESFTTYAQIAAGDLQAISASPLVSAVHLGTLTDGQATITVNYFENWTPTLPTDKLIRVSTPATEVVAATSADDNTHWYLITQTRANGNDNTRLPDGNGTPVNGAMNPLKRATSEKTNVWFDKQNVNGNQQFLARFIDAGNGTYYIQFGNGNYAYYNGTGEPGQNATLASDAVERSAFAFYPINGNNDGDFSWNLNSTTGKKVDNQGSGGNLVFWGSGQGTVGSNSDWHIYPVTFGQILTYNYQKDGVTLRTEKFDVHVGDAYPTPTIMPDFVSVNVPAGTVQAEGEVHNLELDLTNFPFEFDADYGTACHFSNLKNNDTAPKNVFYDRETALTSFKNDVNNDPISEGVEGNVYKWMFVGNPFDGFEIYNLKAGSRRIFAEGSTTATMEPNGKKFKVVPAVIGLGVLQKPFALVPTDAPGKYLHLEEGASTFALNAQNDPFSAFSATSIEANNLTFMPVTGGLAEGWYQIKNSGGNGYGSVHVNSREAGLVSPVYSNEALGAPGNKQWHLEIVTQAQSVGKEGVFYIKPTENEGEYSMRSWNNFYITYDGKNSETKQYLAFYDRGEGQYTIGSYGKFTATNYKYLQCIPRGTNSYDANFIGDTFGDDTQTPPNMPLWQVSKVDMGELDDFYHYYTLKVTGLSVAQTKTTEIPCISPESGTTIPMTSGGVYIFECVNEPALSVNDAEGYFVAPDIANFTHTTTVDQATRTVTVAYTRVNPETPDFDPINLTDFASGWVQVDFYGTNDGTYAEKNDSPLLTSKYPEVEIESAMRPAGFTVTKTTTDADVLGKTYAYLTVVSSPAANRRQINLRLANGRYITYDGTTSVDPVSLEVGYVSSTWSTKALTWLNSFGESAANRRVWNPLTDGESGEDYIKGVAPGTYYAFETSKVDMPAISLQPWAVEIKANTGDYTVTYNGTTANYGLDTVYDNGTFFFLEGYTPATADFSSNRPNYTFVIDEIDHKIIVDGYVTDEDKAATWTMLNNHGLGYPRYGGSPKTGSAARVAIETALEKADLEYSEFTPLFNAFMNDMDIQLPENAKAYWFKNIHPQYGEVYMKYTYGGNLSYTANKNEATKFVCVTLDGETDKFAFVIHDDGASHNKTKFLGFAGREDAKGVNGLKAYTEGYNAVLNPIQIIKHKLSDQTEAATNGIRDMFGKVRLVATEKDSVSTSDFILSTVAQKYSSNEDGVVHYGPDHEGFVSSSVWVIEEDTGYAVNHVTLRDGGDGKSYISMYLPYAVKMPSDVKAYKALKAAREWGTMDLVEVGKGENEDENVVPAGTGVVLRKDNNTGGSYVLTPALVTESKSLVDNDFRGVTVATPVSAFTQGGENCYILSKKTGKPIGFYIYTAENLNAYKAYYLNGGSSTNETNGFTFRFDGEEEATGIDAVTTETSDDTLYDLQGRRVTKTSKGKVYIKNGKTQLF